MEIDYAWIAAMHRERIQQAEQMQLVRIAEQASAARRTRRTAPLLHTLGGALEAWGRYLQELAPLEEGISKREMA